MSVPPCANKIVFHRCHPSYNFALFLDRDLHEAIDCEVSKLDNGYIVMEFNNHVSEEVFSKIIRQIDIAYII